MRGAKLEAIAYAIGLVSIYAGSQLLADVAVARKTRARAESSLERSAELANDVAGLLDRSAGVEHNFVGTRAVCGLCLTPPAHPLHAPVVDAEIVEDPDASA